MNKYEVESIRKENEELRAMLNKICNLNYNTNNRNVVYGGFVDRQGNIRMGGSLYDYAIQFDEVYIYGAGKKAGRIAMNLNDAGIEICGFLVSPGTSNESSFWGKPVKSVGEIVPNKRCGLIVALNKGNALDAARYIVDSGFSSVYFAD